MGKKRIYELAKELGIEWKVVIQELKALGIEVASHSSTIDDMDTAALVAALKKRESGAEKKAPQRTVLRRKAAEPVPEPAPAPKEVEPQPAPEPEVEAAGVEPGREAAEAPSMKPSEQAPAAVQAPEVTEAAREEAVEERPAEDRPVAQEVAPEPEKPAVEAVREPEVARPAEQPPEKRPEQVKPPQPPQGARHPQHAHPPKPRKEHKFGLQIVGPPIPLNQLEKRTVFRPPPSAPLPQTADERAKQTMPVVIVKKPSGAPDDHLKTEKDKPLRKKGAQRRMKEVDRREIFTEAEIGFGTARMRRKGARQKGVHKTELTTPKAIKRIVRMDDAIQVGELARRMGLKAAEIIKKLMGLGIMATVNQTVDFDTATLIAHDYEWEVQRATSDVEELLKQEPDVPENIKPRPPIVTVMGHVDHGKTSLLDAIRSSNKVEQEAGGITQHIGAYQVMTPGGKITFLDTPGHEAFTEMRARGAQATDIVILVVAADDGIQPQTIEAINHAKDAGVPIVVAINKIDKPNAQPERVKQGLTEYGLVSEDWGGDTLMAMVSAKQKEGIDKLLELVLLQAEMIELSANPEKLASGVVVESRLDRGRGPVVTVLVMEGALKAGDPVVAGQHFGKVRAMFDDAGNQIESAGPSTPVEVIGIGGVPLAGDQFNATEDDRVARDVAGRRAGEARMAALSKDSKLTLENLLEGLKEGESKTFKVVLKADVQGSVAPICDALSKMGTQKVKIKVIHSAVGGITESDVSLAGAGGAIIIGFNVRPETAAQDAANKAGVDIRTYSVIYDLLDDVRKAASGLLGPRVQEKYLGRAEVRQVFNLPKAGTIAGCAVIDGKILRSARVRLLRDSVVVYTGKLGSLKRFKDDAREVASGFECGMSIENFSDIKPGDQIEAFEMEEFEQSI